MQLDEALAALPLIAILRGIAPEEADGIADALFEAGFRIVEVPLNSPQPLDSIARIAKRHGRRMIVGAGTVLNEAEVDQIAEAGGRIVVSPNFKPPVVQAAKRRGLISIPGVMTPTEAFAALETGADAIKLFPAELISPKIVGAMRAVLPGTATLIAVGGITPEAIAAYRAAGVDAFGLGSALYKPGTGAATVAAAAARFAAAMRAARTEKR